MGSTLKRRSGAWRSRWAAIGVGDHRGADSHRGHSHRRRPVGSVRVVSVAEVAGDRHRCDSATRRR